MLRVRKRRDFVNQAIKHQLGWCSCIFNTAGISNSLMEHKLDTNTWERRIQIGHENGHRVVGYQSFVSKRFDAIILKTPFLKL